MILRYFLHYGLHFVFPLLIAAVFCKEKFWKAYLVLLATMFIDLDHLLATPIFDPNRCSIGFHPLHTIYALAIYVLLVFPKKTRIVGIGLILHLLTDFIDCQFIG
jgi:hypothetical protein